MKEVIILGALVEAVKAAAEGKPYNPVQQRQR
jgi:hypothetical protein